ncbi:hypothetical protein F0M18_00365 [Pseudohalioglobus sediminis]|uniref:Uncharacterized protein n=1 Tax=Pseudohalioglobus sediminis TaxID=2606449 RepID=A0A5B0X5I0_9GAMM|nr:hypothetical protein [Pseudohalioglobus sediminis]KAA1193935.1 hypothetical protein F0M18_00365 [Pseudohalioglobus sediminis]
MQVKATHPETGETITVEISEKQYSDLEELKKDRTSRSKLQSYIDNLDIPADAKNLISRILDISISIGSTIIRLGQRIIEFVVYIVSRFPNATFGVIFGLLLGALVATIPLVGSLLGAFVMPISAAFGLASGYMDDIRDNALKAKVGEAVEAFSPLKGQA